MVSHPRVYKVQRRILGAERLERRLAPVIARAVGDQPTGTIVDVGGGTGRSRLLWPESWSYTSIDPDERAVHFGEIDGNAERSVGSASALPFPEHFADAVLMKEVSHHLDDETWSATLSEIRRILKPQGTFVFLDGVLTPRRWLSRLVWSFDVGRHPRQAAELERAIAGEFEITSIERFSEIHRCLVVLAQPR